MICTLANVSPMEEAFIGTHVAEMMLLHFVNV